MNNLESDSILLIAPSISVFCSFSLTGIFSADIWLGEVIDPAEDGGYSFPMSGYDFGISNKVIFSPMAAYREWGFQIRPVAN